MKTTLIIIILLISSLSAFAQPTAFYCYDAAGNRVMRGNIAPSCIVINPVTTSPEDLLTSMDDDAYQVEILPNPTLGELQVIITDERLLDNQYQVLVMDNNGKEIMNRQMATGSFNVDLTNHVPGIYYLKIISEERTSGWRIIKL